jgi:L-idonate 5-dehydrogenase
VLGDVNVAPAIAVDTIGTRRTDVRALLTATLPVERAVEAFELASDRSRAIKVQLAFGRVPSG